MGFWKCILEKTDTQVAMRFAVWGAKHSLLSSRPQFGCYSENYQVELSISIMTRETVNYS